MKLSDLVAKTDEFNVKDNILIIGFADGSTPEDLPEWPMALQPLLLKKEGQEWVIISKPSIIGQEIQEEQTPEWAAKMIINYFNDELNELGQGELTWNQRLILIFQTRLALVNNQFVIN